MRRVLQCDRCWHMWLKHPLMDSVVRIIRAVPHPMVMVMCVMCCKVVLYPCLCLVVVLFRYQGHVSAALILGGVDLHGPHLFTVSGSSSRHTSTFNTVTVTAVWLLVLLHCGRCVSFTLHVGLCAVA